MRRVLYLMLWVLLFVGGLVGCTEKTVTVRSRLPIDDDHKIIQTLYVDSRFTEREFVVMTSAANEWTFSTRGMVMFNLVYPYEVQFPGNYVCSGKNIVLKTNKNDPRVIALDKSERATYRDTRFVLGFVEHVIPELESYYLGMVMDRIMDDKHLKEVFMHELGHTLHLVHAEAKPAVMNGLTTTNFDCLTRYDMEQFADLYNLHIDSLNYCEKR